jgi:ribonuclease D
MTLIDTTDSLAAFCRRAAEHPYVTVDTEFLRERTYYARLCLLQIAHPGSGPDSAIAVDTLAPGLDLSPVYDLFRNTAVMKVFHAARQDLEIFQIGAGLIPAPLFDTQVAAMVCGFGEQVAYDTLARKIAKADIDKSSRFTDWSHRPLSAEQLAYALADVTHLRQIYEHLSQRLARSGRAAWVAEEMAVLNDPATYRTDPALAWEKVRTRSGSGRFLAILRELARFREEHAQSRDIPRSRVFKDDALIELASLKPQSEADLAKSRLLLREARRGEIATGILAAVRRGLETRPEDMPRPPQEEDRAPVNPALADLLRVLLKARADAEGVAQKLIATAAELDAIAAGSRDVQALRGWRREIFGNDALLLCEGRIALAARGAEVVTIRL